MKVKVAEQIATHSRTNGGGKSAGFKVSAQAASGQG